MFSEEEIKQMETNYDAGKEYHAYEFKVSDALWDNVSETPMKLNRGDQSLPRPCDGYNQISMP